MTIGIYIRKAFPMGLEYDEAAQLCLLLYSANVLPEELMIQCTKNNLPVVFAELSASEFINTDQTQSSVLYGANFHDPKDKGHWIEIIASIFKIGETVDQEQRDKLKKRLTNSSTLR